MVYCQNRSITVILLTLLVSGCGPGLRTIPASGVLRWNGQPLSKAELTFMRKGAQGPAAIATTNAEGHFRLTTGKYEGIVPGKYTVIVQKSSVAEMNIPDPLPDGMELSAYLQANNIIAHPLLPAVYGSVTQTPLEIEITEDGPNEFELQLQGTPPTPPKLSAPRRSPVN